MQNLKWEIIPDLLILHKKKNSKESIIKKLIAVP